MLQLILHDTVLFPEGGGQPTDIGILTSENGVIWDVELVKRHGGVAVHYVGSAEDIDDVPYVFAPGKEVNLELGQAGFQRRLDHVCPLLSSLTVRALTSFLSDEHAHRAASPFFCHRHQPQDSHTYVVSHTMAFPRIR